MATIERTYTVPLRSGFRKSPKYYRTNRAMATLRVFLVRHLRVKDENLRIGQYLNEFLWRHGIKNPPARVKITVTKDDEGIVRAELEGKAFKDVIKPKPKSDEAPSTLKEKLESVVGGKKGDADEASAAEEKAEKEKAEKKAELKKTPAPKMPKFPSNIEK